MFSLPRQIYNVTADSPLVLSPTSTEPSLGPRTTVVFRNLKGEGREYTLQGCSVAKVVIDGCSDLKLRIRTPILTSTLEVFNSASLTVYVGSPGQQQHQVASTVLLDPPLAGVALVVPLALPSPTFILSSAIPPSAKTTRAEAWVGTTLRATASAGEGAADEDDVVLRVPTPPEDGPEQWTFKLGQEADGRWGWGVGGLQREEAGGEGDGYPILR